jgi:hypothetical protein
MSLPRTEGKRSNQESNQTMMIPLLGQGATNVNSAITDALAGGLTSSTTFAVAAIAISVVFFTLKLGKRGLNKG